MTGLQWNEREYETGTDRGVFFPPNGSAEAWTGLVSVSQKATELRSIIKYRDGIKIVNRRSEDSFSATIEAYSYPPILDRRVPFGFSYRVKTRESYKIHLVYNALGKLSERSYKYSETEPFSIDISTTPFGIFESSPSAHLVVDAAKATPQALLNFENAIYGSDAQQPRLLSPSEVMAIFDADPLIKVIDNGDGTFTVDGPDDLVRMLDDTLFEVNSPTAVYIDDVSYSLRSF